MKLAILLSAVLLLPSDSFGAAAASKRKGKQAFDPATTEAVLHVLHAGRPLGSIVVRLFPDSAPSSARRFLELSASGFFEGTHFHRVIPGFLVQGGDPRSRDRDRSRHGTGYLEKNGRPQFVPSEFSGRSFKRGSLGMARGMNPDSGSSQFFITLGDSPHLDRQYTVFGEVVSGIEVADRIASMPRDGRDNPVEDVVVKSVELRVAGSPAPVEIPRTATTAPRAAPRPPPMTPKFSRSGAPGPPSTAGTGAIAPGTRKRADAR